MEFMRFNVRTNWIASKTVGRAASLNQMKIRKVFFFLAKKKKIKGEREKKKLTFDARQ